ncbi:MAG: hypothetical protein GY820_11055 [Gammaproteobacteria bacterium]|nr:hypothetical protein [Gammaproteobacteria bacterium]
MADQTYPKKQQEKYSEEREKLKEFKTKFESEPKRYIGNIKKQEMFLELKNLIKSFERKNKGLFDEVINDLKEKLEEINSLPNYSSKILEKIELLNNSYLNPGNNKTAQCRFVWVCHSKCVNSQS